MHSQYADTCSEVTRCHATRMLKLEQEGSLDAVSKTLNKLVKIALSAK